MVSHHFSWWLAYSLPSSYFSRPLSDHLIKPYFHTAVAVFSPHPNPQFFTVVLRQGFILWARVLYIIQAALEFRVLVLLLPEVTVLGWQDRITPSDELCSQPTAWFFPSCQIARLAELVTMNYTGLSGLATTPCLASSGPPLHLS